MVNSTDLVLVGLDYRLACQGELTERGVVALPLTLFFVCSDRSSLCHGVLLKIELLEIFTQSINAIDVTRVTLSRLNIITAIGIICFSCDTRDLH